MTDSRFQPSFDRYGEPAPRSRAGRLCAGLLAGLMAMSALSPAARAADLIEPGDKLSLIVRELPELTGEFSVDADGDFILPLLGSIATTGKTKDELRGELIDRLKSSQILTAPSLGLQIVERRPIFVLGDVQSPGSYAFQPGITPVQAVALAGGLRNDTLDRLDLRMKRADVGGSIRGLKIQILAAEARKARLALEQSIDERTEGAAQAESLAEQDRTWVASALAAAGPDVTQAVGDTVAGSIIENERRILRSGIEQLALNVENLRRQQTFFREEVASLEESIRLITEEERSMKEEVDSVRALVERALTPGSQLRSAERELFGVQRVGLEVASYLARARQRISEIDERILNLYNNRIANIYTALQDVDVTLADLKSKVASQENVLALLNDGTSFALNSDDYDNQYRIERGSGEAHQVIDAGQATALRPADVIYVDQVLRHETGPSASLNERFAITPDMLQQSAAPEPAAPESPAAAARETPAAPPPPLEEAVRPAPDAGPAGEGVEAMSHFLLDPAPTIAPQPLMASASTVFGAVSSEAAGAPLAEAAEPEAFTDRTAIAPVSDPATIQRAQAILAELGYGDGVADGLIGPQTVNALRAYQRSAGLAETGMLTSDVLASLESRNPGPVAER
ncbi:peptidoglycan-binding protein [Aureimonas populi]|uniref:Peptidoglycan-binding protein n=1 Tax=Aureimonas populi TaxID=1701758 RepID=A0ABW5CLC3_9HYPH|nr:peptidoglycan-binding protein [Aureimonas populi]